MNHEFLYVGKKNSMQVLGWCARPYPRVDLLQYPQSRALEFDNERGDFLDADSRLYIYRSRDLRKYSRIVSRAPAQGVED